MQSSICYFRKARRVVIAGILFEHMCLKYSHWDRLALLYLIMLACLLATECYDQKAALFIILFYKKNREKLINIY